MNCVERVVDFARERPDSTALWVPHRLVDTRTTFAELVGKAGRAQAVLRASGLKAGDTVLLLDALGPRLYATIMAVLSMGASVILVEPWMPLSQIEQAVRAARPRLFVTHALGRLWGMRVRAVREIGEWLSVVKLVRDAGPAPLLVESVDSDLTAVITFTSGTTGRPKGTVRTQGVLADQHRVLSRALNLEGYTGPDLCIFANFVLANLASGRCTLLIPPSWPGSALDRLDRLGSELQPETLTCGPAFLLRLMKLAELRSLKSIHVGGALTDCQTLEMGFAQWPGADWIHVYGSTEAEPVAVCDARQAVRASRQRGLFQTLYLGKPVAEIDSDLREDGVWVTGPHVCPRYIGNVEENRRHKRQDPDGRNWHFMGDRIRILDLADGGWWYSGRSSQRLADFELEQLVYSKLGSSKSFIYRRENGEVVLLGENISLIDVDSDERLSCIDRCINLRIYRDRRHRARIDRSKSIEKGAGWLLG